MGPQGSFPVMTFSTVFHELAAILMIAGIIGIAALKLRQPLIIGYILTGIWWGRPCWAGPPAAVS